MPSKTTPKLEKIRLSITRLKLRDGDIRITADGIGLEKIRLSITRLKQSFDSLKHQRTLRLEKIRLSITRLKL